MRHKKLTEKINIELLSKTKGNGYVALQAALKIKDKADLTNEELDVLIEAGYYKETGNYKPSDEIISSRLDEIFSVMGFLAEHSERWKIIMNDSNEKKSFTDSYKRGAAEIFQRTLRNG
ncbi:hypothetical protein KCQ_05476 [Pectobacterium atrosepticum ICMP 1526]|uniref:hypothetical protein n=1 Tax=Pectobacterium atrosepticum TaxID=29471 RepID=UPI00065D192C|nr:hypothetical protein [Pectobacterium atrosepticum]KMK87234.1 hypothetical protein KCQ_05476 [Pectobacterium atrosepticum ICMP 1526]